ncbi:MAG: HD-GYP domain-containing protein [Acidimicrobiia bacterium]|nr:HD-GYP domain-containing protein [Acidimicrobiia bacterium]
MTRDVRARQLLKDLQALSRQMALYPTGHPTTGEALTAATASAEGLASGAGGEVVLSLLTDSFYLDRTLLAHASIESSSLLRTMQGRGIESITFLSPVAGADIADLGAFVAGLSGDVPAESTVRLNESPYSRSDLESDSSAGLRRSYTRSLDVLRGVAGALDADEPIDLSVASWAVEQLVEQTISQPAASLLLSTMKSHDEYTFFHSVNVCILSISLGRMSGLEGDQLKVLAIGALLHDIGKIRVDSSVLQFPGRLDHDQWNQIKLHPQEGAASIMAAAAPGQEIAATVAFEHHARFDGSGYPRVARREHDLHFFSRLVATTDTYDAITTRRSYRRAETPNRALGVLLKGSGTFYDPDFVRAFIDLVGIYPPGSLLLLDGGEVAMVTKTVAAGSVPDLVLVKTADGTLLEEPEPIAGADRMILDQMIPGQVGVDPAALLEKVGIVIQPV